MLAGTEGTRRKQHDALLETAINFKVEWEREFERCDRLGVPRPEVFPHPDHVVIDIREGTVHFNGPVTKEENAELDMWIERKAEFNEELEFLKGELEHAKNAKDRKFCIKEIERTEKVLGVICRFLPDL